MKRMERLERAVAELQREFNELNGFTPSPELDLRFMRKGTVAVDDVATYHKGRFYNPSEHVPEEVEI